MTGANGTYSFKNLPYGTYYVREVTPAGQIETAPNSGYYTATTSVSTPSVTNENFANFKPCNLSGVSGIYYSVTTNGWTNWVSDLRGHTSQGSVVTAYFDVAWGSTDTLTLASYIAPSSAYSQATAPQQTLFCYQTQTFGAGWHSLTVTLPKSYYQVDFACGSAISQFGGAGSNVNYNTENRLISADNGGNNAYTTASYAGCGLNWNPCTIVAPSTNKNSWCFFLWF